MNWWSNKQIMAILKVTQHFEVTIGGNKYEFGSKTTPQSITIGTEVIFVHEYSVATATLQELWSNSRTSDFDFMFIESDQDCDIQLVSSEDVSDELGFVIALLANVPFILSSDGSADLAGSTVVAEDIDRWETELTDPGNGWDLTKKIDRVEYYQTSGSSAKVIVAAFT